jgi:hypothetical protein
VIKFVRDLRQVDGFLLILRYPPPIKLAATIYMTLLKVVLLALRMAEIIINCLLVMVFGDRLLGKKHL